MWDVINHPPQWVCMGYTSIPAREGTKKLLKGIKRHGSFDSFEDLNRHLISLYVEAENISVSEIENAGDVELDKGNITAKVKTMCREMGMGEEVTQQSVTICSDYYDSEYGSGEKKGSERVDIIAGAAIYLSAALTDEQVTQAEIAERSGCVKTTIRHKYKKMQDMYSITELQT